MDFFKKLKEDIEDKIGDMSTIEHALFVNKNGKKDLLLYRFQQTDGDSIVFMNENESVDPELIEHFNKSVSASMIARTGITQFLIELFTKPLKL